MHSYMIFIQIGAKVTKIVCAIRSRWFIPPEMVVWGLKAFDNILCYQKCSQINDLRAKIKGDLSFLEEGSSGALIDMVGKLR